jgi:hypothetical protein
VTEPLGASAASTFGVATPEETVAVADAGESGEETDPKHVGSK